MSSIRSSTRLALSAGLISVSVIWLAVGLNLVPDATKPRVEGRLDLMKAVAVNATVLVEQGRLPEFEAFLKGICDQTSDITSCGIRSPEGKLIFKQGPHDRDWDVTADRSNTDQISVQVFEDDKIWGSVEVCFAPLYTSFWQRWLVFPMPLIFFCGSLVMLLNWSYLGRTLRQLNPSKVVPKRVRTAFDALSDGLLLIDNDLRIVMANLAFERISGATEAQLQLQTIDSFRWQSLGENIAPGNAPWHRCLKFNEIQRGELISMVRDAKTAMRFAVSATPIHGNEGDCRGALISFHDVTALETKKEQMGKMLLELAASRDEVQKRNRDLQILASTDSLTGCLNRRSFFDRFAEIWERGAQCTVSAIMVDIDHFKSINDNHGHSTGDLVLQAVGSLLMEKCPPGAIVGRYGGEEFAIALPDTTLNQAAELAEAIQVELRSRQPQGLEITMSIGVSCKDQGAMDYQHLIDQADQSLYLAKREGRNRVMRWDHCNTAELLLADSDKKKTCRRSPTKAERSSIIQYPAVTAMLSALAFRDRDTAVHSTRVARLCLLVGRRLMNNDELYELETAALLHDIGKIGVPDTILRKPGPLTPDEWEIMNRQNQIGVEIVRCAFASERIIDYIRSHHLQFAEVMGQKEQDVDQLIPLGARIITVCDAFDSMTNDRVYRSALSREAALEELYRWSTVQFDPMIVRTLERVLCEDKVDLSSIQSERSTLKLGAYVEQLTTALSRGDVMELSELTKEVEAAAAEFRIPPLADAANKLEKSITANGQLEQYAQLADEIIELCRSSRSAILDNPEVLRSVEILSRKAATEESES